MVEIAVKKGNATAKIINEKKLEKSKNKSQHGSVASYFMIMPQFLGFLLFAIYPIIWVIRFAWFEFDGVTAHFNGIDNFIRLFTRDADYWLSLANTFILTFGKLAIELPLALLLAVVLNSKLKGKAFFRTMFYMPNVIGIAIIGLIFYFMFASFDGIVNNILLQFSIIKTPVNWFENKWTALVVIAIASIWQNFGINMLFFLSGLQSISKDLYECAEIDGASKIKQFFHITIPMLAPIMQIVTMLAIIGTIKMTDLVLVLTNGQPAGQSEVVMTYIFKYFFSTGEGTQVPQIGYASSMGLVTAIVVGLMTIAYLKTTKKMSSID